MSADPTPSASKATEAPESQPEPKPDRGWLVAGAIFLLLAALGVYWPCLRGQFLWDDYLVVHQNPLVTGKLSLASLWLHTDFPLTTAIWWLEWLAWGDQPLGYHVVNILLHASSALLLWRVLARLRVPAPWLAALIFAVHPVCAGSVAWISELKNTLSLPFFLLSLLWYLRPGDAPRPTLHAPLLSTGYVIALSAFVLALFSKTSTVMLPVVLLGCAWWQRGRINWRDAARTIPFFALALAFGLMSIRFQAEGAISGATVQQENLWGRLAGAGMALWFYLEKTLLPLKLSMIYPRWHIDAASPLSYLPLLLWGGLLATCWQLRRTWGHHLLFGLGCFSVLLFPVLGFFDMFFLTMSRVSDHFVYLPLVVLVALGAGALGRALQGVRLWGIGGAVVLALAALTMLRARAFISEEALWRDTLAKNPAAWVAHANLGWILASQQHYDQARAHLEASLALKSNNGQAHSNLGRVLSLQGNFPEAEAHFQTALALKPRDPDIRNAYAEALAGQGKKAQAMAQFEESLRLRPDPAIRLQLAALLHATGKTAQAAAEYRQVLAARPDEPEALNNLAWLLATAADPALRDGAQAVQLAEHACRLSQYKDPRPLGTLAAAYAETGRFPEAVPAAQKAIEAARAAGDTRLAAVAQQLLRHFRAGQAYHEPPAAPPRQ